MNIRPLLEHLIRPFRSRRMEKFNRFFERPEAYQVLDVGGTIFNWKLIDYKGEVVLLNLTTPQHIDTPGNFRFIVGDGTALTFENKAFDIVFSNSVIEHVGTYEQQRRFASELRRVGDGLWLQTPAKSFFFEPHYLTPFIHFLSKSWQKILLRNFSIWGLIVRPSQEYIDSFVEQTTLLGYSELKELFPDCNIAREKFLFMTKSYIVYRKRLGA